MSEPEYKLLVSIDFGTYGFYVAYAHPSDCQNARAVRGKWTKPNVQYDKILNAITLRKSNLSEVLAYGFEARDMYIEAKEEKEDADMAYFENFKLQLRQEGNDFNANKLIKAADHDGEEGTTRELCPLVAQCLGEIKKNTLAYYTQEERPINENEILWILSIPVCWTEDSQEAMRQCCLHIDIPESNILIVRESEAAGCYLVWGTEEGSRLNPGDKYLCVDMGHGTFDIACHQVLPDGRLEDVHHMEGELCGSFNVDRAFETLLANIFGEEHFAEFKRDWPTSHIEQLKIFQDVREKVKADETARTVRIDSILVDMATENGIIIAERCANFRLARYPEEQCLVYKEGNQPRIEMRNIVWEYLFSEVAEKICENVEEILRNEECEGIKQVFVVGGFSKSDLIQKELAKLLNDYFKDIELICPLRPELAVVRGSLWFADKEAISRRQMKLSYGMATERETARGDPWDLRRPDPYSASGYKTIDCFDTLWDKGESFEVGQTVEREFPLLPGQKDVSIEIFRSDNDLMKFVDESCKKAFKWRYEIPPEAVSVRPQTLVATFKIMPDLSLWLNIKVRRDDGSMSTIQRRGMDFNVEWNQDD